MPGPYAVGIDAGATKILGGLIDCSSGEVLNTVKSPSPTTGADDMVNAIEETIRKAIAEAPQGLGEQATHIGIGLAGQVDKKAGVLLATPNLGGGVKDVPLVEPLQKQFNIPIKIGNDVEVAAIGESRFGAGKGVKLFACVFVGTGIGGALVQDGVRYGGASGSAGEIGHIMVRAGGRLCGCGQRGHLEAYASRTAIVSMLREAVEGGATTSLATLLLDTTKRVKSKPLSDAIKEGDPLVVNVMTQAGMYLGLGLATLINLWNPQRIVLGGGVIDRIDMLFNAATEHAKQSSLKVAADNVEIVKAALGDNSAMVGAALL